MKLSESQLRKLVREMSEYSAHEPKLFEYLETLGVTPSHLEMFLDITSVQAQYQQWLGPRAPRTSPDKRGVDLLMMRQLR
jgi:hypothetical protein